MKIDYTIVNIINKQIESYGNRIRRVQVDVSESDKRNVKIIGDVLYVKALESEYEIARIAAEQINKNFREEDILGPNKEIEAARRRQEAIEYFEVSLEEAKERWERQLRIKHNKIERESEKEKKNARKEKIEAIKKYYKKKIEESKEKRAESRKKRKEDREKNKEKRKRSIRGFVGFTVLAPTMILGTAAAAKSIQAGEIDNKEDRNIIVEYGNENFENDQQIRESINSMLESEIRKATGKDGDISFESGWVDSKTKKTVLNVGDEEYKYIKELEGKSNGNLSGELANLIDAAKTAEDTEELMNTWIRVKKFSKNKDLKVEGNNLVEVDSKEDDFER